MGYFIAQFSNHPSNTTPPIFRKLKSLQYFILKASALDSKRTKHKELFYNLDISNFLRRSERGSSEDGQGLLTE